MKYDRTGGVNAADGAGGVGPWAVWFGMLGGVAAWALHLGAVYAVLPYACATGQLRLLDLFTAITAIIAATALFNAVRVRRRARSQVGRLEAAPGAGEALRTRMRRTHFMGVSGILLSGFFLALILFEGGALLIADPCILPTYDRPIVRRGNALAPLLIAAPHVMEAILGTLSIGLDSLVSHERHPIRPGEAWSAWTLDLLVLGPLLTGLTVYTCGVLRLWRRAGRGRGIGSAEALAGWAGFSVVALALVSPIHALGTVIFSLHMVQHLLLMAVAAPLLVLGRPGRACIWALSPASRQSVSHLWQYLRRLRATLGAFSHPIAILVLHAVALWVWHLPALYQAALVQEWIHHLEHASFFGASALFWWSLTRCRGSGWWGYGAGILYVFAAALQGGALGALITFAPVPIYPDYAAGAELWGIDLLDDQQLAGVLMWVPAGLVYASAAVVLLVAWLRAAEAGDRRRSTLEALRIDQERGCV